MASKGGRSSGSSGSKDSRSSGSGRSRSSGGSFGSRPRSYHHYGGFRPFGGIFVNLHTNSNSGQSYQSTDPYAAVQDPVLTPLHVICSHCGTRRPIAESKCPGCGSTAAEPDMETAVPVPAASGADYGGTYRPGTADYGGTDYPPPVPAKKPFRWQTVVAPIAAVVVFIIMLTQIFGSCAKTYNGEIGQLQQTKWFDFNVNNAEVVYGEYSEGSEVYPGESGYWIVCADITVKNTDKLPIEMYYDDFILLGKKNGAENTYTPIVDGSMEKYFDTAFVSMFRFSSSGGKTMYSLMPGETKKGRLVFKIPTEIFNVRLNYDEIDEDGNIGAKYFIKIFD